MFFYEWGFLLILESDKRGLQNFPEKGNEEGEFWMLRMTKNMKIQQQLSSFSSDLLKTSELMIDKLVG